MASAIKKCRVCGAQYEACRSAGTAVGVFRWQEVACSPECGMIYLQRVNESRGITAPQKKNKPKKQIELAADIAADTAEPVITESVSADEAITDVAGEEPAHEE